MFFKKSVKQNFQVVYIKTCVYATAPGQGVTLIHVNYTRNQNTVYL